MLIFTALDPATNGSITGTRHGVCSIYVSPGRGNLSAYEFTNEYTLMNYGILVNVDLENGYRLQHFIMMCH
jgi:hypothetical protein